MHKKVVVMGGGNGLSTLLRGLREFPFDLTAVVTVCDDGKSTGRLREEFGMPAVGDLRRVLVSLSNVDPLVQESFNYRFETTSDLNGHTVGNLLITALTQMTGSITSSIDVLRKLLQIEGTALPLTEDKVTLVGTMDDGSIVEGEHHLTFSPKGIEEVSYKEEIHITKEVLTAIEEADLIILSIGSLYTSILPNIISNDVKKAIDVSKAKVLYTCNIMTQPGETAHYTASDHVKTINRYLGTKKLEAVFVNTGHVPEELVKKYETLEQKDLVIADKEELEKIVPKVIYNHYAMIENNMIRHDTIKLGSDICSYML